MVPLPAVDMSGGESERSDVEALRVAREEGRATLDGQLSTLDDIDSKALSVFRLNVAVVGVLLSVLSVGAASDVAAAAAILNPVVGAGVGLFVLSAAAAGLTYTAVGQQVGASPAGLVDATDLSERAYLERLVERYAEWIRYNQRTNVRKALLVTLSILGTVAGTLGLGVGVLAAFTGRYVAPAVVALVVLSVLSALTGLPGQLSRLFDGAGEATGTVVTQSLDSRPSGQRTFKGRDREQ